MNRHFLGNIGGVCGALLLATSTALGASKPAPSPTPKPSPTPTPKPAPSATASPSATPAPTTSGGKKSPTPPPMPSATPVDARRDWGNTGTDFNTNANWSAGTGGLAPGVGDVAWFTSAAVTQPNLSASVNIAGIYFSSTTSSGYNITSTGGATFTLTANQSVPGAQTTHTDSVAIAGNNTSLTNTIAAPIILAPFSGGTTSTIFQATGGTMILSGVISGSGIGLGKTGGGQTNLTGTASNTYSGVTTVSAGTLGLGKSAGINAFGGDLTINGGSVIYSAANNNQIPDFAKVTITSGSLAFGARTETIGETATPTSGLAVSGTGAITISSGQINIFNSASMTGGTITITSSGRFQLNTDFAFSGGTIDFTYAGGTAEGVLFRGGNGTGVTYAATGTSTAVISNSGGGADRVSLNTVTNATTVFSIADSPTLANEMTISAVITGGSTNALQKTGTGQLTLAGANTYLGATQINGGTLVANVGTLTSTSSVTVNSGGTLLLSGNGRHIGANTGVTLAGGTFNTGGFSEPNGGPSGLATSYIGALTLSATSTIDFGTGSSSILEFAGLGTHTGGTVLQIINWDGVPVVGGAGDRLLFAGLATSFTTAYAQSEVSFNGVSGYSVVQFDIAGNPYYEVTASPIPEPATWIGGGLALAAVAWMSRRKLPGSKKLKREPPSLFCSGGLWPSSFFRHRSSSGVVLLRRRSSLFPALRPPEAAATEEGLPTEKNSTLGRILGRLAVCWRSFPARGRRYSSLGSPWRPSGCR